ncbi:MAG: TlpA family protein disulfide reductase [Bradymonadales bacterium]|nr:MAG: TlpA family protein disulfide reductase [Bradymonadales bacterium]
MSQKFSVIALVALIAVILYFVVRTAPNFTRPALGSEYLVTVEIEGLHERVQASRARVKLVNVWATWCLPCLEEFPYLMRLKRELSPEDFDLIFVSADVEEDQEKVLAFLSSQGVDFETYLMGGSDEEFIRGLHPEWSGALPATAIYDSQAEIRDFWIGDRSFEYFKDRVGEILNHEVGTNF